MKATKIILSRIDMAAMLLALAGLCLISGVMAVMAMIDFARMVSSHWANHDQRWLVVIPGLAVIWLAMRWKHISSN